MTGTGPDHQGMPLSPMGETLGLEIVSVTPDAAEVHLRVHPAILNGFGITHGGAVFTLADEAFALACNGNPDAEQLVAQQCEVDYLRPTREGDLLVARAGVAHRGRTSGIYDVIVTTTQDGQDKTVAIFRGRCRALPRRV